MKAWPLDQPIPRVCFKEDICRIVRVSMRQLEGLLNRRELPLEELPAIDRRRRFTGASVAALTKGRWASSDVPAGVSDHHEGHRSDRDHDAPREAQHEFRGEVRA